MPYYRLVARPVIGPALDIPLCLFFCHDHADVESLVDRYQAAQAAGRRAERAGVAGPG